MGGRLEVWQKDINFFGVVVAFLEGLVWRFFCCLMGFFALFGDNLGSVNLIFHMWRFTTLGKTKIGCVYPLLLKNPTQGFSTVDSNKTNIPMSEKINVNPTYMCEFLMKLFLPLEENVSVYL